MRGEGQRHMFVSVKQTPLRCCCWGQVSAETAESWSNKPEHNPGSDGDAIIKHGFIISFH